MSRRFWRYLGHLPPAVRAHIVRSKFEIEYDLPKELTLKLAETEDEIEQALRLVHDAYVELEYMDASETKMRFTKHHAHPNAVILIAKWLDDVIGTLTIIPDSALGLPSDSTWSFDRYRAEGKIIAEISSLTIKKDFRMRRGRLLLPLCKFMYVFCTEYLKLDGVVAATTLEVEPFYTDILLFEKIGGREARSSQAVKGDHPAMCGFLSFSPETEDRGRKIYGHRPDKRNLYKFMKETATPNLKFPERSLSVQGYVKNKNAALARIFDRHPALISEFRDDDKQILKTYDLSGLLEKHYSTRVTFMQRNNQNLRPEVRRRGWCHSTKTAEPIACKVVDVSANGLRLNIQGGKPALTVGDVLALVFEVDQKLIHLKAEIRWTESQTKFGCRLLEAPQEWGHLIEQALQELRPAPVAVHAA